MEEVHKNTAAYFFQKFLENEVVFSLCSHLHFKQRTLWISARNLVTTQNPPTDFWRTQAAGGNDTRFLTDRAMRRYFERFLGLCDKQVVLKKKHLECVSMQAGHSNTSFKALWMPVCIAATASRAKHIFRGKHWFCGAPFRAERNLSLVCNFRGQCIISAGVAPHYLNVTLGSGHTFCFLRTARSGGMALVFADTSVSQKLSTSWHRIWEGGTAGTTDKLLCLFKGALFLHLVKKKKNTQILSFG